MKAPEVLLILLALGSLGSARVDGEIKEFGCTGYPNVASFINLLEPCVAIENSGDESAKYFIGIEIVDDNGGVHYSGCRTTPFLQIGEMDTIRSYSIDISLVSGSAEVKAKLYESSCLHGKLLTPIPEC